MATIVYRYWCEPATAEDARLLKDQIFLAKGYRRELVDIENRGRALRQPRVAVLTPEAKQCLREGNESRYAELGITADHVLRECIMTVQSTVQKQARAAAVERGLHWGTYQDVDEAMAASCRMTKYPEPVSRKSGSSGCVAVHLQPARTLRDEGDTWVQIGRYLVRHGSEFNKSGQLRPKKYHEIKVRVGSDGRWPRWAVVHARLHRPLPAGAPVSWVRVKRRTVGSRERWEIHFTVSVPDRVPIPEDADTRVAACGVDIGWRQLEGRVRVAYWWGTDGEHGEVCISNEVLGADEKADSLRAIRDRARNQFRDRLLSWIRTLPESSWIVEETRMIHLWTKTWRFIRLVRRWRNDRIEGDETVFADAMAWDKQDRHLWNWEAASREKRKRRVDETLRVLAVTLARRYRRIGVEKPMVARLVRKADKCVDCTSLRRCSACMDNERLRRLAATRVPHAAPARTRQELHVFGRKYGSIVLEVDAAYTTMDCALCGHRRTEVDDWSKLNVRCAACGMIQDQDFTAAMNLARLASETVLDEHGKPLELDKGAKEKKKLGARRTRKKASGVDSLDRSNLTE